MSDVILRRVGTTIRNKWTLERLLGAGGMAAVYVGMHRIGRRDALKILHPQAAQSKEICDRFEREAQAANRFRHVGAVEIRDIDVTEDGAPFLVMEMLDGESLADRERRLGGLTLDEVLLVAEQVVDTLRAAHDQGIIHRDIKPGNLFVTQDERVKVLDFGLARIRQDNSIKGELTRMGIVLGTTPYMPPEQAKGRDIDARADLFAVGATMFRLIAGRHVHEASDDFELLMKMAREPAPPLALHAPLGTPRDVCLLVDRALAFDRDQRYPDAGILLEDIRAVLRNGAPPYASRFARGLDPDAPTMPGVHLGAPMVTAEPPVSVAIPVSWTSVPDAPSITVDFGETGPSGDSRAEASPEARVEEESIRVDWSDDPVKSGRDRP